MKKKSLITIILSICLLLLSCNNNTSTSDNNENIASTDKVYHSAAPGYNGLIEVDVTIGDNIIKDVKITSEKETPGIGGPLLDDKGNVLTNGGLSPITLIPKMIINL